MPLAIRGLVQLCETLSFVNTYHSNVNAKTKSKWLQLLMPLDNGFVFTNFIQYTLQTLNGRQKTSKS